MTTAMHSLVEDFERFRHIVDVATRDLIPDSSDRPSHVDDLAAKIVRLDPQLFGTVASRLSAGDLEGAEAAAREGLARLEAVFPWLTYPADSYKRACRMAWRKMIPGDHTSADGMAFRATVTECRRELAQLLEMNHGKPGWSIPELEAAGERVRLNELAVAGAREKAYAEKVARDREARNAEYRRQLGIGGIHPDDGLRLAPNE